jgi:hypothetical protein
MVSLWERHGVRLLFPKIGWEPQVEAWGEFSLGGMKGNFCSILRVV